MSNERAPGASGIWEKVARNEADFLGFDEQQLVWDFASRELGADWHAMDRAAKDRYVERYVAGIIKEIMEMSGGIWATLSVEQKRELFRARFIDKTVKPAEREAAYEDVQRDLAREGLVEDDAQFPDMEEWLLKNRKLLPSGMMPDEAKQLYAAARKNWEKKRTR